MIHLELFRLPCLDIPVWVLVVIALAVLAWMEWGKVRCLCGNGIVNYCDTKGEWNAEKCRDCHGSGRVRRRWISGLIRRK